MNPVLLTPSSRFHPYKHIHPGMLFQIDGRSFVKLNEEGDARCLEYGMRYQASNFVGRTVRILLQVEDFFIIEAATSGLDKPARAERTPAEDWPGWVRSLYGLNPPRPAMEVPARRPWWRFWS